MGLHIARYELIAVQHLLPRAPLGSLDQETAEATALLVQTLDVRNQVIGRPNAPGASLHHLVDDLVGRTVDHRGESHGLLKVLALIASCPNARLGHGLFAAVGQKDSHRHAPVFTMHGMAILGGGLLGDLPELVQVRSRAAIADDTHGEDPSPVLASKLHTNGRLGRRHDHGKMRLRVGSQVHHRITQDKPVRLIGNGLGLREEAHDNAQRLVHAVALLEGINAQHVGVRRRVHLARRRASPAPW